jgi:hypothetical protein
MSYLLCREYPGLRKRVFVCPPGPNGDSTFDPEIGPAIRFDSAREARLARSAFRLSECYRVNKLLPSGALVPVER